MGGEIISNLRRLHPRQLKSVVVYWSGRTGLCLTGLLSRSADKGTCDGCTETPLCILFHQLVPHLIADWGHVPAWAPWTVCGVNMNRPALISVPSDHPPNVFWLMLFPVDSWIIATYSNYRKAAIVYKLYVVYLSPWKIHAVLWGSSRLSSYPTYWDNFESFLKFKPLQAFHEWICLFVCFCWDLVVFFCLSSNKQLVYYLVARYLTEYFPAIQEFKMLTWPLWDQMTRREHLITGIIVSAKVLGPCNHRPELHERPEHYHRQMWLIDVCIMM